MQLPSVGRGEIYRMMIDAGGPHVNSLTKCYRTDKPDLFDAYEAIRAGKIPESSANFKVHLFDDECDIDSFVVKFINDHKADYMYVAWQNKDVTRINKWVQTAMLKSGKIGPATWGNCFYLHDRVVYRGENIKSLTNAMTGAVIAVEADGMSVKWDDSAEISNFKKDAFGVQLMYCGTCHIMQGSEYHQVCVLCYDIPKMIKCSDRKWIYTAVTRAQDNVVFVSTREVQIFIEHPIAEVPLCSLRF
jgi:ATP-dependent exoDNAse (exonuclease V) alpha subunit